MFRFLAVAEETDVVSPREVLSIWEMVSVREMPVVSVQEIVRVLVPVCLARLAPGVGGIVTALVATIMAVEGSGAISVGSGSDMLGMVIVGATLN